MQYDHFLNELGKARLSVKEFAGHIGMSPNSITNYARKGVPSHLAIMAVLMAEMRSQGIDFLEVLQKIEPQKKKPRGGSSAGRFGNDRQHRMDLS